MHRCNMQKVGYYIQNAEGKRFFFTQMKVGEVPVSNQGSTLGSIKEIHTSHNLCVVIDGHDQLYRVFPV